jgi:hypothetical protein
VLLAVFACGGPPFVAAPAGDDASTSDAPTGMHEAGLDAGAPDEASPGDATAPDAPDAGTARDASVRDALPSDARGDAVDEPPPHCASGFACAPAVPSGWSGPFEIYVGPGAPPPCGVNFSGAALDGHVGLSAPAASCACTCGQASGVQCSSPALTFYSGSTTCTLGSPCSTVVLGPGACTPVDVSTACGTSVGAFMTVPPSTALQGTCGAVPAVTVPPSTWTSQTRACAAAVAPARADCAAGNVCAPAPSSPFGSTLCVEQSGNVPACPTGYTARSVSYGAVDDTRACSACTCGPVTGASCGGSVTQFASTDGGCQSGQIIYPLGQSCDPVQQPADLEVTVTASGGSCAPGPTAAIGAASAAQPTTFCCAP